jgi:hypothetical protein
MVKLRAVLPKAEVLYRESLRKKDVELIPSTRLVVPMLWKTSFSLKGGLVTDVRACSGAQSAIHKKSQLYKVSGRVAERVGAFNMRVYVRVFPWLW